MASSSQIQTLNNSTFEIWKTGECSENVNMGTQCLSSMKYTYPVGATLYKLFFVLNFSYYKN